MNFNHLVESHMSKRRCSATNGECYFIPAGNVRSTQGNNVHINMVCKRCAQRVDIFLTREEYFTQQKLIQREIENV